jgi:N-acyl-D-amino-acid deacylase
MYDILFRGCRVVDGSGAAAFPADVAVAGGRIVCVGTALDGPAATVVDAHGLCLAPGFIDPHTHSDLTLLADGRAESRIRQGITTEVIGNCGSSAAPLGGAAVAETVAEASQFGVTVSWRGMDEYLTRLRRQRTAVNVVALAGHNTVRGSVLGYDDVQPDGGRLAAMERLVGDSVEQGARGLSSGLFYPPGSYASVDEVAALAAAARAAAARGAAESAGGRVVYASHIRDEASGVLAAVEEAIAIGERAGVPVEVSHLKLSGPRAQRLLSELLEVVAAAADRTVPVGFDLYPYTASGTWLIALLPYPDQQGGAEAAAARLEDPAVRARLHADYAADRDGWEERSGVDDWTRIVVGLCPGDEAATGRSLAELGDERGRDPLDVAFDLIAASRGLADATFHDQSEDVVRALIAHPTVAIGSDGWSVAPDGPLADLPEHPRTYGTFPRVLGRYVRELGVLRLEEAVRKMTSLTAERFGLTDRGVVRAGAWADLVLFDPSTIVDTADFVDPKRFPEGVRCVTVNGRVVLRDGARTAELPGVIL